jgi:hypothetical protein
VIGGACWGGSSESGSERGGGLTWEEGTRGEGKVGLGLLLGLSLGLSLGLGLELGLAVGQQRVTVVLDSFTKKMPLNGYALLVPIEDINIQDAKLNKLSTISLYESIANKTYAAHLGWLEGRRMWFYIRAWVYSSVGRRRGRGKGSHSGEAYQVTSG